MVLSDKINPMIYRSEFLIIKLNVRLCKENSLGVVIFSLVNALSMLLEVFIKNGLDGVGLLLPRVVLKVLMDVVKLAVESNLKVS